MIYTKMEYLDSYVGIHVNLDKAIGFLRNCDLRSLSMGRNEVDGDQVFINRFNYDTMPIESAAFEAHEKHLDIHLLLSGRERIGISDTARMQVTGRDEVIDGIECVGPAEQILRMAPGDVLIAFPEDAHMVKVELDGSCQVEKAVVKVQL